MSWELDKCAFEKRLSALYAAWTDSDDLLGGCDAMILSYGSSDNAAEYSKSLALQKWLFGFCITDTIIVFLKSEILFYATKTKMAFLKQVEIGKENADAHPSYNFILRDKKNDSAGFQSLISQMKKEMQSTTVGSFPKDEVGDFLTSWMKAVRAEFKVEDVSANVAPLLAVKDDKELGYTKSACTVVRDVFKNYYMKQMIAIMGDNKSVKHSTISEGILNASMDPKTFTTEKVDPQHVSKCYDPIIQSGTSFSLKFIATSNNKNMQFNTVISNFGFRYLSYCCNLGRTYLVNPSDDQKAVYENLLATYQCILENLVPGKQLKEVHHAAVDKLKSLDESLVPKLTKNFGFVTGIEFRDGTMTISATNEKVIKQNMTFVVLIGLNDLVRKDKKVPYAILLSDTVAVQTDGPAVELTNIRKFLKNIIVNLGTDDDEDEEDETELPDAGIINGVAGRRALRNQTAASRAAAAESREALEKRANRQRELFEELMTSSKARILALEGDGGDEVKSQKSSVSYKSLSSMPFSQHELRDLKLFLDKKYSTMILPICGQPTPIHISFIKNVSQSVESGYTYFRINLSHPGGGIINKAVVDMSKFAQPNATFVKELTFRAPNDKRSGESTSAANNLNTVLRQFKESQKKWKDMENEAREKEGIIEQDKLVLSQAKTIPRLRDLYFRPAIGSRRVTGTLEAHVNGFRYITLKGDKIDVLYNNIKHAFYQPCDHEMIILLHFHLKNPIILGKKRQHDVQVFIEVGEVITDLNKRGPLGGDRDDLEAEQAEREMRNKFKQMFKLFIERVGTSYGDKAPEFETPFRDLGFTGAPFRSSCFLQPTDGGLVNLTEWPPFVLTLSEVELAHLERVQFQLKTFDIDFVFKDYKKKPQFIGSIAATHIDQIKDWLTECDIAYTETEVALNWTKILKTINLDPVGFFETGGWSFLQDDKQEDGEEEDEESEESEFVPSDADDAVSGSEEIDSEDDSDSDNDDNDEDFSVSEDDESSGSESGKSWSELEEEAAKADRHAKYEDSYDEKRKKRSAPPSKHHHHSSSKKRRH